MNTALLVEEAYRILTDEKQNGHLVLLDAKATFDKSCTFTSVPSYVPCRNSGQNVDYY
jgi:hypothetical protein